MEYVDEKLAGTGIRCYVYPGNDDMFELDDIIKASKRVEFVEGKLFLMDEHHRMINYGLAAGILQGFNVNRKWQGIGVKKVYKGYPVEKHTRIFSASYEPWWPLPPKLTIGIVDNLKILIDCINF